MMLIGVLSGCGDSVWNNPYPASDLSSNILYSSFSERPKHLDPAVAYSSNEYALIAQVYEPVLQYHYLLRPYRLVPLSAEQPPEVIYRDREGRVLEEGDEGLVAFTDYVIAISSGIRYQPHPAFAKMNRAIFCTMRWCRMRSTVSIRSVISRRQAVGNWLLRTTYTRSSDWWIQTFIHQLPSS